MKKETAAMKAVVEAYFSEAPEGGGLAGASQEELLKRLGILRYGYEARVRASLEDACGFIKSAESPEGWLEAGRQFCYQQAFHEEQLGLLPLRFFEFLDRIDKDHAVFQCQHRKFIGAFSQEDLQRLTEDCKLELQATVFWLPQGEGAWVVSRNRERFFENEISNQLLGLLNRLRQQSMSAGELMALVPEESVLAAFFTLAISSAWLKKPV